MPTRQPARQEEFGWLVISIDNLGNMSRGERLARLQKVIDRLLARGAPPLIRGLLTIGAVEVLHDDVGRAVFERPDVENPGDMFALNPACGASFARESGRDLRVGSNLWKEEVQRDAPVKLEVVGRHNHPHAVLAKHPIHPVLAREDNTRGEAIHQTSLVLRQGTAGGSSIVG